MVEISGLYNDLKTLCKQWFYDKTESDARFSAIAHTHKNTVKTVVSSGSLNNVTTTGWYSYTTNNANNNVVTDVPVKVGAVMEVLDDYGDGKYVAQTVYPLPSTKDSHIYYRMKYDAQGWSNWIRIDGQDKATLEDIPNPSTSIPTLETQNGAIGTSTTYAKGDHSHPRNSWISYGQVDSTSTSTVFTATVPNLTELIDGATVMLRNGVVNSASGFTLDVNNLGAKPVYSSMHNATADTTIFKTDYTMLFVYDTTRITNGCWICYRGYNTNDNTIGYQIRTNSTKFTTTDKGYKYRIWLETDNGNYMPVNISTSESANANKSSAMNTREFWLGGKILYNGYNGTTNANAQMVATTLWQQFTFNLGYAFNNTSSALALTSNAPLYMVAEDRGGGKARLTSPYYTQTLPSSEDDKLYIYLGHMYSATNLELALDHPIYEYKDGEIRLYRDYYTTSEMGTVNVTVTYSDNSTETLTLYKQL